MNILFCCFFFVQDLGETFAREDEEGMAIGLRFQALMLFPLVEGDLGSLCSIAAAVSLHAFDRYVGYSVGNYLCHDCRLLIVTHDVF